MQNEEEERKAEREEEEGKAEREEEEERRKTMDLEKVEWIL